MQNLRKRQAVAKSEAVFGDNMAFMATCRDNAFGLAVVDCPYGIGEDGSKNHTRGLLAVSRDYKAFSGNDLDAPPVEFFKELQRASRHQIIFGANHFIDRLPQPINSPCWIVWDKDNGLTDFADCELAWTSFPTAVRKFKFKWQGMLQENGGWKKEQRIHPTQKPVELYRFLLKTYAQPNFTIFDPNMGSQSSRIAAYDLGFDYVGCELDEDYYKAGCERFDRHIAQGNLFREPERVVEQAGIFDNA